MIETDNVDLDRLLASGVVGLNANTAIRAGVDRVELAEFARLIATGGDEFLETVYTVDERNLCGGSIERLAARFGAKEAATKVLGTGIRGIGLNEIEVVSDASGEPRLQLHGRACARATRLGIVSIAVSLTHTSLAAEAFVVALAAPTDPTKPEENSL